MIRVLLAGEDPSTFKMLLPPLEEESNIDFQVITSLVEVKKILSKTSIQFLVVASDLPELSGIEFLRSFIPKHPFINCALLSSLSSKEFHVETEGLGLFAQFPATPALEDGVNLRKTIMKLSLINSP